MVFLSPAWLIGLAPWSALAIWLFRGRRPRVRVPFLNLWRGPIPLEIPKSGWEAPPLWVIATLFAILAAILAAARPLLRITRTRTAPISIFVDRGITMSARQQAETRFARAAEEVNHELAQRIATSSSIDLLLIPGDKQRTTVGQWFSLLKAQPPTALATHEAFRLAIRKRLQATDGPVLVLSELPLDTDDRVIQVWSTGALENVGITRVAARVSPTPQVMVELKNESSASAATIRVSSGIQRAEQRASLPKRGGRQNYFVDLPSL